MYSPEPSFQVKTSSLSPLQWLGALASVLQDSQVKSFGSIVSLEEGFSLLRKKFFSIREQSKRVWWVGNGGSLSLCSHLSQDLLNKLSVRSQVLNDPSQMSCMANDFGYENVYARPLALLMDPGDLLMAISSSGKSKNILDAIDVATKCGASVVGLSAFEENNSLFARADLDLNFYVPTKLYGLAEVGHEALIHAVLETTFLEESQRC